MRVVLIAAQSLDGFITRHDLPGAGFTSAADRAWFPAALEYFDVGILGGESYRESRDVLLGQIRNSRCRRIVLTRQPERYAADAIPGKLEFTSESPETLLARLRSSGVRGCAVLGGSQINGLFLATGAIDELWLTLEPRVFGHGRSLASGTLDQTWHLRATEKLGPDVLLLRYWKRSSAGNSVGATLLRASLVSLGVALALVALGAALGAALFPLYGWLTDRPETALQLMRRGVRDVGFYFTIWSLGIGIAYATVREWRRRQG